MPGWAVGACAPTLVQITVDGNMSDWSAVLADPDNVATDPQGTRSPSSDRDYPVQSTGRDLLRFAYTWDSARLYLYAERDASTSNTNNFFFYADLDDDGRMKATDVVLVVRWWGNTQLYDLTGRRYVPANGALGDPLVDAGGRADGYTLPGTLGATLFWQAGLGGCADGVQLEASVSWAQLGLAAGAPIGFHVSTSNSTNVPDQIDDNMGGPPGGGNSTGYAALSVTPDRTVSAPSGATLVLAHSVTNSGNIAAAVEMWTSWSCPEPLDARLYFDANGDAEYQPATDPPLVDSNGDGRVDHEVGPGATLPVLAVVQLPAGLPAGRACALRVTAEPRGEPDCGGAAVDQITIGGPQLTLVKGADRAAARPGEVITYTTSYTNAGNLAAYAVALGDPVPSSTTYVTGSAAGAGTTTSFSHDNGVTWDVSQAPPVTHVRWTLAGSLPAGGSGAVSFRVRVN